MKASCQRVLRALREAGERGLTTGELTSQVGPRFSARIHELEHEHRFIISSRRESQGSYRYTLLGGPKRVHQLSHFEVVDGFACRVCFRPSVARQGCHDRLMIPTVVMQPRTDQEGSVAA